jgi:hypothetical protein
LLWNCCFGIKTGSGKPVAAKSDELLAAPAAEFPSREDDALLAWFEEKGGESLRVAVAPIAHKVRRCKKLRIAILGFGTARQKMVLERWTNPKPLQTIWDRVAI